MKKILVVCSVLVVIFLGGCADSVIDEVDTSLDIENIIIDPNLTTGDEGIEVLPYELDITEEELMGLTWTCYNNLYCHFYDENQQNYLRYNIQTMEYLLLLPSDDLNFNDGLTLKLIDDKFYAVNEVGNLSSEEVIYLNGYISFGENNIELTSNQIQIFEEYTQILMLES